MDPAPDSSGAPPDALAPARACLERRDFAAAAALLADPALAREPGVVGLRAQAAWGGGRYAEALAAFEAAATRPAAGVEDVVRWAQALASSGDSARARAVLDARPASMERSLHAEFLRALYALDDGPPEDARARLSALAAEFPGAAELVIAARALEVFAGKLAAAPHDFGRARANARWQAVLHQARHVPPARMFGTAGALLRHALGAASLAGITAEFGVFHGRSLRQIAALATGPVHGFDSFEGLPEDWTPNDPRGSYSTHGMLPEVPANVVLHRGWFAETLPGFAASHPGPLRFAHVDCDLYASTRTVLDVLGDRLVAGTVLVFDDYLAAGDDGEARAFAETVARRGLSFEYLGFALLGREAALRIT